jgi:hypothetical protein
VSSNLFQFQKPRFNLGDHIVVTVSGMHRNRQGSVIEIIAPRAGDIYRYRARFKNKTTATFYGFELTARESSSSNMSLANS